MTDYDTYKLGDWELQRGGVLKDAFIAYKTFGDVCRPAGSLSSEHHEELTTMP